MEKYAKPIFQGSGRSLLGKRREVLDVRTPATGESTKRGTAVKKQPKEQVLTEDILFAQKEQNFGKRVLSLAINDTKLIDFKAVFELIPAVQKLLDSDPTDEKFEDLTHSYRYDKKQMQKNIDNFLTMFPAGLPLQFFYEIPQVIKLGFGNYEHAQKELSILLIKLEDKEESATIPNDFFLFWKFYGSYYDPPIIPIEDLGSFNLDSKKVLHVLGFTIESIFGMKSVFDFPLYLRLVNGHLAGRSLEDLKKQKAGFENSLSRKLFAKTYPRQLKKPSPDACFMYKPKLGQYVSTPTLTFIRTLLNNIENPVLENLDNNFGSLLTYVGTYLNKHRSYKPISILDLEKDCQDLYAPSKTITEAWKEKRMQHLDNLRRFLKILILGIVEISELFDSVEEKKRMEIALYGTDPIHPTFTKYTTELAEMFISELELRHQGYICFYAARSGGLNGIAIEMQEFGEEFLYRNPQIPKDEIRTMFSNLVESTCYRPSIAQKKTALEMISSYYQAPFLEAGTGKYPAPLTIVLMQLVETIRKSHPDVAKLKGDNQPMFQVWARKEGIFMVYWVLVTETVELRDQDGKFVKILENQWYFLLNYKNGAPVDSASSYNIVDILFVQPSALQQYIHPKPQVSKKSKQSNEFAEQGTRKKQKKPEKSRPIKYEEKINDNIREQRDRIRSANMSFFANLNNEGESTIYYFLANRSVASMGDVFDSVLDNYLGNLPAFKREQMEWITKDYFDTPKKELKKFSTQQDFNNLGTILRFAFPCSVVADFAYVSLPYGKIVTTETARLKEETLAYNETESFEVEQYIRFFPFFE